MKKMLLFSAICLALLTSCDTFWQGMAQGMGGYGYGGYGRGSVTPMGVTPMGGSYIGPVYCPPINTQAIQQGAQMIQQQAVQDMVENAKRAQQVKAQIEAQAAYNVQHGIVPVVVDNSSSSSVNSSSSSSNSIGSSSTSSSHSSSSCRSCYGTGNCQTCYGQGWYDNPLLSGGKVACPNCPNHNGRCSKCGGSGKI